MYNCQICGKSSELGEALNKLYNYRIVEDRFSKKPRPEISAELKACAACYEENKERPQFHLPEPPYQLPGKRI